MNSTEGNDKMLSLEAAVQLWRSGGIDSDGALEQVRELVGKPSEQRVFAEPIYEKALG